VCGTPSIPCRHAWGMDKGRAHAPKRRGSARGQPRSQTRMPRDRARPRAHPSCPSHAPQRPGTAALPGASPRGTTPTRSCIKDRPFRALGSCPCAGCLRRHPWTSPSDIPPGPSPRCRESPTMSHVMRAMPHPLPWAYSPAFRVFRVFRGSTKPEVQTVGMQGREGLRAVDAGR